MQAVVAAVLSAALHVPCSAAPCSVRLLSHAQAVVAAEVAAKREAKRTGRKLQRAEDHQQLPPLMKLT